VIDSDDLLRQTGESIIEERPVAPVRRPVPRAMLADFLRAFGLDLDSIVEGDEQVVIMATRQQQAPDRTQRVQERTYDLDLGATLGIGGAGVPPAPDAPPPPDSRDGQAAVAFGDLPPGFRRNA